MLLCIVLGAGIASIVVVLGRDEPSSAASPAASTEIARTTAETSVAANSERVVAVPREPSRSTDIDGPPAETADEAGQAATDVTNPFVENLRAADSATRGDVANDGLYATLLDRPGGRPVPLGWCFRAQSGFVGNEANSGRAPQHGLSGDTSVVWHGSTSARIGADDSLPLDVVGVMWQAVVATPFRDKRVEVSAYARTKITRVGHFFIRTQAQVPLELLLSDQNTSGAKGINQYVPRDADWERYKVVHDVPADAEVMYYGFALYGGGRIWIDDVRISIVDEAAPLSHYGSIAGNPNIAIDPTWILPAPLNLDFELTSGGPTGGAEAANPACTPPAI